MEKSHLVRKILETFFLVVYFIGLMKLVDFFLITFVNSIGWMNILTIPLAFAALVLSAWLSERTVKLIKKFL
ncbi:MAG: hypothetical protein IJO21_02730 [Oscillospiraceae bacterium]|nr:hypothetical protein [Oscillospiraceae bacterium]